MDNNNFKDIYGKYSLIALLCALEDLKETQTSCLEELEYYEEGIKFGDTSCIKDKKIIERDLEIIKDVKAQIKYYLIPLSN